MSDLRTKIIRLAHENKGLRSHLLPLVQKQAGPRVTRTREGFAVEGGQWPQFILDSIINGSYFAAERPPDKVEGTASYLVKPRSPDALCRSKGDIEMIWRSPTRLTGTAAMAYFEPMGRSLKDFTELFGPRSQVSLKGGRYQVQYAAPNRNPVEGLVQITMGSSSMYQKMLLADMKRDGVLEDASIQIGGTQVGTVLIPKGLSPILEDLRGLFK